MKAEAHRNRNYVLFNLCFRGNIFANCMAATAEKECREQVGHSAAVIEEWMNTEEAMDEQKRTMIHRQIDCMCCQSTTLLVVYHRTLQ